MGYLNTIEYIRKKFVGKYSDIDPSAGAVFYLYNPILAITLKGTLKKIRNAKVIPTEKILEEIEEQEKEEAKAVKSLVDLII
jgi:hypothetical protein